MKVAVIVALLCTGLVPSSTDPALQAAARDRQWDAAWEALYQELLDYADAVGCELR